MLLCLCVIIKLLYDAVFIERLTSVLYFNVTDNCIKKSAERAKNFIVHSDKSQ